MLNMEDLLKMECDERLSEIVSIVDHNQTSKEYKCICKNGDVSQITILNDKNPRVNDYLKKKYQRGSFRSQREDLDCSNMGGAMKLSWKLPERVCILQIIYIFFSCSKLPMEI